MQYHDLKVYVGPTARCDSCGTPFTCGEVVTVADGGGLVFCYSDGDGGCLIDYVFSKLQPARMLIGSPMVYREHRDQPVQPLRYVPPKPWWKFW